MPLLTMTPLSLETWVILGIIGAITLTCCAHVLASLLREHDRLVKFHISCESLRADYDRRMRELTERRPAREAAAGQPGSGPAEEAQPVDVLDDPSHAGTIEHPSHAPAAQAKAA